MAYQQVGTPIFYVNMIEWLVSNKAISLPINTSTGQPATEFLTLPVKPVPTYSHTIGDTTGMGWTENGFVATLGHTMKSQGDHKLVASNNSTQLDNAITPVVNCDGYGEPDFDGFTIYTTTEFIDGIDNIWVTSDNVTIVGSIILGTYYEMPHSPDLNLSLSYDYGGIKEITTRGGASLSNSFYSKPPMWGDLPAWELWSSVPASYTGAKANAALSHSGRKVWDLSFSYLDDGDVFGSNQSLAGGLANEGNVWGNNLGQGYDTNDVQSAEDSYPGFFNYNILSDDNFYSQVIHKTNGGQLPFIFQPNKDDNTNFAICKIDSGFSFEQVANGVYNVKMKIREVW